MNRINMRPRPRALAVIGIGFADQRRSRVQLIGDPHPRPRDPRPVTPPRDYGPLGHGPLGHGHGRRVHGRPAHHVRDRHRRVYGPDSTDSHWLSQDGVSFQNWMKQLAPNVKVLVLNATGTPRISSTRQRPR